MNICATNAVVVVLAATLAACHAAPRPSAAPPFPGAAAVAGLRGDIDAMLAHPALARGSWGVEVRSLASHDTLYALNARKLLMPASAMKIVTLAAAADRLGWDYTYETRLVGTGQLAPGVLDGDLVVVGSGDPSIVERDGMADRLFDDWADALRQHGIRRIAGRIIGDDNAFDDEPFGAGWSWDDLAEGYAAGVSALQYNENRVQVTLRPGPVAGMPALAAVAPDGSGLVVDNIVTTAAAGTPPAIDTRRLPGSSQLELRGSVPLGSSPIVVAASVDNPTRFFVTVLRDALMARGIEVDGPAIDIDDIGDAPPPGGLSLVSRRSEPLSVLIAAPFKFSLNLHEETLLKSLGAAAGAPAFATGRTVVRSVLQGWGIDPGEIIQIDGSGLSRYNYITAGALVAILEHVDRDDRLRGPFREALPVAGREGTLAGRMTGTPAEGNARAKTGSMANTRTLAGYVTSADGEPLVFSILANNFETAGDVILGAIDGIVVRLAQFSRR